MPSRIGIVTSPTGAALRDILHILRRRFPAADVLIYPTAVQGAQAAPDIQAAVELASARAEVDVLIVARGGGSLEDLWAFNDEGVARAIHGCAVPVITGIGHEVDFTIADFVADLRAPTPSGAAELAVPDGAAWRSMLARLAQRFALAMSRQQRDELERLQRLQRRFALAHPGSRLAQSAQRLDELEQRLVSRLRERLADRRTAMTELRARLAAASPVLRLAAMSARLQHSRASLAHAGAALMQRAGYRLELAQRSLHSVSPLATLGRGYAIVSEASTGRLLRDARDTAVGAEVEARLGRGRLRARVLRLLDDALPHSDPEVGDAPSQE